MKLAVPANYDLELLPFFADHSVTEVYGKLPSDVVGGGRPTYMGTPIGKTKLGQYMSAVSKAGMEFNYLLNAACFGNEEWTHSWHKEVRSLLDWLSEQKVPWLTVSAPYLLQIIKKHYPQFKVKIGIYAQVDTVKRAKYWEDEGADAINLESFSINRDFEKLARIREAVRCDLPLIANHFCQPNCPYQMQHQNGHAHASSSKTKFLIDYPLMQCQQNRLTNPSLFISSGWIRPEDLHHYEAIGYHTFKLLERNIPSADLKKRVQAYHDRRFDGNFAELILSFGFKQKAHQFSWRHFFATFKPWKVSPKMYKPIISFLQTQGMMFAQKRDTAPIVINSRAIPDDFLERFKTQECNDRQCSTCGYCQSIANQAVRIDTDFLDEVLPLYKTVTGKLVDGQF